MTPRIPAPAALALGLAAMAVGCRLIAGIDDKVLVDGGAGAGGCASTSGSLACTGGTAGGTSSSGTSSSGGGPGCADGTREGFLGEAAFPTIAGCAAAWGGQSMRTPPTGVPCGNDLDTCATPADACAPGWHVCLRHGYPGDLTTRIKTADCAPPTTKLTAMFVAAADQSGGLPCGSPLPCSTNDGWSIAVCCGHDCFLSQSSCVFPNNKTPFGIGQCGAIAAALPNGVLCCMDPEIMQ